MHNRGHGRGDRVDDPPAGVAVIIAEGTKLVISVTIPSHSFYVALVAAVACMRRRLLLLYELPERIGLGRAETDRGPRSPGTGAGRTRILAPRSVTHSSSSMAFSTIGSVITGVGKMRSQSNVHVVHPMSRAWITTWIVSGSSRRCFGRGWRGWATSGPGRGRARPSARGGAPARGTQAARRLPRAIPAGCSSPTLKYSCFWRGDVVEGGDWHVLADLALHGRGAPPARSG